MRREGRHAAGCVSAKGTQALVCLPLGLAAFALVLQFSGRSPGAQPVALPGLADDAGVHSERARFMQVPERALSRAGDSLAHLLGADREYVAQNAEVPKDWQVGGGYLPDVPEGGHQEGLPKVAFMTTTSDSFRQIQLWSQYHRALGVSLFYLFVDGQAARPDIMAQLRQLEGVRVIPKTPELRHKQEHSRIWNETWLAAFFHKPCNHELFVHQSLNMEEGIGLAREEGADWVLHIDTDELMYPGGAPHYSLQAVLADVPGSVDTVVFPNYESLPERDDITDPFTQVTLFKRNFHHVMSSAYFQSYKSVTRGNPNYFITYGNGKSAARVQNGLRPNGAHRWFNYFKHPREVTHESAAVLHYTYNRFADLKARRDRCDCAPTEADAKRCFILPFDRLAFLAASLKTDEELQGWFRERLVWNDPEQVKELVKNGLFYRIYTPQVLIRGFIAMNENVAAVGGKPVVHPAAIKQKAVLRQAVAPLGPESAQQDVAPAVPDSGDSSAETKPSGSGAGSRPSGSGSKGGSRRGSPVAGSSADADGGAGAAAPEQQQHAQHAELELADSLQTGGEGDAEADNVDEAEEDADSGAAGGDADGEESIVETVKRAEARQAGVSGSVAASGSVQAAIGSNGGGGSDAVERRSAW